MDGDFMRKQIEFVATEPARQRVAERLASKCWPDGGADRTHPIALGWVGLWRPMRSGIDLLRCGCATGYCEVCN